MLFVRPATRDDAADIARIDVETWRSSYAGILPDKVLLNLTPGRLAGEWQSQLVHRPDDVRVAEWTGAGVIGFGSCGTIRHPVDGLAGEVHTLYVSPRRTRRPRPASPARPGSGCGRRRWCWPFSAAAPCRRCPPRCTAGGLALIAGCASACSRPCLTGRSGPGHWSSGPPTTRRTWPAPRPAPRCGCSARAPGRAPGPARPG